MRLSNFGLIAVTLSAFSAVPDGSHAALNLKECFANNLLVNIEIEGQDESPIKNLIRIENLQKLICEPSAQSISMAFNDMRRKMRTQTNLLEKLKSKKGMGNGEYEYYQSIFRQVTASIYKCEDWAKYMKSTVKKPIYDYKIQLRIKPSGLYYMGFYDDAGNIKNELVSHEVWLGSVMDDTYYNPCNVRVYRLKHE